ncbi:hypothetical protein BDV97DRAFT_299295 [Delphinella strobiligena]|nr:hypothetical protein BDV97DRAFT_299295 [Delphinella strobiligena]
MSGIHSLVSRQTTYLALALALFASIANGLTVSNTILVFARDTDSAYSGTSGLSGYGIPYQTVIVPQAGVTLPTLNSSADAGNYAGFIVLSEVSYDYNGTWSSALTTAQWQQIYDYQNTFGARLVRLDVYPGPDFGVTTTIDGAGCCDTGVEQLISITNDTAFPTANIVLGAGVSSEGLWHYPATITNSSIAEEIAQFANGGSFTTETTAAVINTFGTRQQMVWFSSWATSWSPASNFLQHAYIHWITRGLFVGRRRIYLDTQVDDMHLETELYSPAGVNFRVRPADLEAHVSWMASLNARLPAGSNYFIEIGHNGNGAVEAAVDVDTNAVCDPETAIEYPDQVDTPLEFQKPPGTGTNIWPTTPTNYTWSLACVKLDDLATWFTVAANRDAFAHISHTFSHESLDNATYSDANKEIYFNVAWLKQVGIYNALRFTPNGIIPPAITGLHNADVLRAWDDNGIVRVVGDNTRPVLLNTENEFWPLISTVAANGYAGITIVPRWATTIYYNCDLPNCTTAEWIATSAGSGDFTNLLNDARSTNVRHLLGLHHDPFMFHQANLRQSDVPSSTVGSQTGQFSLLQIWVETVLQELTRLTTWPIITLKHDDIAQQFINRMALDQCNPNLTYIYSPDKKSITGATVTANSNTCSVPIPITFPGKASTSATGTTTEQVGSDPLTIWTTLSGEAVTFDLASPIAL